MGKYKHDRRDNMDLYNSWSAAKYRCTSEKSPCWKDYGGRGVRMCDRWLNSFDAFCDDMGPRPPGTSLDRIDTDDDYEPGNCRWATKEEQTSNKRSTIFVMFRGEQRKLIEFAREFGIGQEKLRGRVVVLGWDIERALSQGV